MIAIELTRDKNQMIQQVKVEGHAGYADPGYDIVCAAVSSQLISVENSLHHLLKIQVQTEVNEIEGGYLKLTLPRISSKNLASEAQLLLRHLELALSILAENYPEFITIQRNSN